MQLKSDETRIVWTDNPNPKVEIPFFLNYKVEITSPSHDAVMAEINRLIELVDGRGGFGTFANPFRGYDGYHSKGEFSISVFSELSLVPR